MIIATVDATATATDDETRLLVCVNYTYIYYIYVNQSVMWPRLIRRMMDGKW